MSEPATKPAKFKVSSGDPVLLDIVTEDGRQFTGRVTIAVGVREMVGVTAAPGVQAFQIQSGSGDMETATTLVTCETVTTFLPPDVAAVLLETEAEVRRRFGGDVQLALTADVDPDAQEPLRRAVLTVGVALSPEAAMEQLEQLDREWWMSARDRAVGGLELDLAFV